MSREAIFDRLMAMQFQMEPSQRYILKTIAKQRKTSMSVIIRELVEALGKEFGISAGDANENQD
tara:strand:- start:791 stop:982 length:192 start_codon:yes stop_codon:yes gene_type:complete